MFVGRRFILRLSGFILLSVMWQIIGGIRASPAIPPLNKVIATLFHLVCESAFRRHITASISIVLTGLGAAVFIGTIIGVLLFQYEKFKCAALPIIECVRGVASLTLFPLLIVLFGLGAFARVFIIFWTSAPAVILSVAHSLDVDKNVVDAARICGANEWRVLRSIRLPMAAQGIITGIRIAAGGGFIALIPAEMLGATKGLGYYLMWSSQSFEFDKVYATIITIAAIGGLMNLILLLLQKKLTQITGGGNE